MRGFPPTFHSGFAAAALQFSENHSRTSLFAQPSGSSVLGRFKSSITVSYYFLRGHLKFFAASCLQRGGGDLVVVVVSSH